VTVRKPSLKPLLGLLLLLASPGAGAVLTIEITGGEEGAVPIAVVPFGWEGPTEAAPEDVAGVVAADLRRSGRFAPLPERDLIARPTDPAQINLADWRLLGAESLLIGRLAARPGGGYLAEVHLLDVFKGTELENLTLTAGPTRLREMGHRIADIVYERLTGERGAFNTRIAYVTSEPAGEPPQRFSLQVADSDGHNFKTILASQQPIMSPAWSPDGQWLAYVSFEEGRPEVFVHEVASTRRRPVATFPGINSAPAWSPDGTRLALTLSKGGNPDIYVLDLNSGQTRQLTRSIAIDTEPAWLPSGDALVFTSDRGGRPQLYRVGLDGGAPKRITFEGDYNARAAVAPDGKTLAMVHRDDGAYRIAVMDLASGALRVLTEGQLDESPSFAPNGRIILYATERGGRGVLAAVSVDGRAPHRLTLQEGDVREPAWGPFTEHNP
jgi:TolB protein